MWTRFTGRADWRVTSNKGASIRTPGSRSSRLHRLLETIGLQGFEDVTHRGGAAFDRIQFEVTLRPGVAAHGPLQVFAHDLLVVYEHAVGHGVIVADNGIDQLVHERVRLEAEPVDRPGHHL